MTVPMIQVTNVSPQATQQQMKELLSYLGDIEQIKIYPDDDSTLSFPSKVCFVKFKNIESCQTALHLTNSVLLDRALIVVNSKYEEIPDETVALSLAAPAIAVANIASQQPITHTAPLLPTPPSLLNMTSGIGTSVLGTPPVAAAAALTAAMPGLAGIAPAMFQLPAASAAAANAVTAAITKPLISVMGTVVPQPPPLTGNVDPTKIEEIRRTVYVGNLSTKLTAEQVLTFFQPCGEIRYVRMAGDETQPTRFAFVEFASPDSVPIALQYNGAMFGDRPVKVNHSKNAIVKPQGPTPQEERREIEEAMKRIKEANQAIAKAMDTDPPPAEKSKSDGRDRKKRSRSHSQSRSRSGSRDRSSRHKRSRSRSRDRRKRSYSRSPRRRSRSPRRRSRTPPRYGRDRYYSRRDYGSYNRRSPSPRRDRDRHRHRDRDRERERERERDRERERERDRERREKERDRERRERRRSRERRKSVSVSPRHSPSRKSRNSRRKEKRELSRTPSPMGNRGTSPDQPSPGRSSRHSRRSKKDKKKKRKRSPSYSVSPTPSAESESPSPSPAPATTGSVLWGSDEDAPRSGERGASVEKMDAEEARGQSSAGESEGEGGRYADSGQDDESDRDDSLDRDRAGEELSDVE